MDLSPLLAKFPPHGEASATTRRAEAPAEVADIVSALGGVTLAGGLYRVFTAPEGATWTAIALDGFPEMRDRVTVFAADWLGRLFATDASRRDDEGALMVLLLEPGTGEALEMPVTLEGLHTTELLDEADAALAVHFYEDWRSTTGDAAELSRKECVGYRVPLRLGGTDTTDNLERTDMSVYWALAAQLRQQTAAVPLGTPIESVAADAPKRRLFRKKG